MYRGQIRQQITGRTMITGAANVPAAYQQDQGGPQLVDRTPRGSREFPVGFESAAGIAAAGTATLEVKPQVYYRGERLAVAASIATNFDLTDIKVGKDSQLAVSGNMPCECFSNVSVGVRMILDTAEPGIVIDLFIINTTAATTSTFRAVLFGTIID
jgi:hypothetical protein